MQASIKLKSVATDIFLPLPSHSCLGQPLTLGILLLAGMLGTAAGYLKVLANVGTTKMTQETWS